MARWRDGMTAMMVIWSCHLAILPSSSYAIDANAGTGGASFMKLDIGGARAAGMGKAFTALASGPDALLYNPAGIAGSTQRELSFGVTDWVQGVGAQSLGYVHPLGRTVLGFNASYLSVSGFDVRDDNGIALPGAQVRVRDSFATAAIAHSFLYEKLFLGLSLKEVYENNAGPTNSTVVEDFGAVVRPNSVVSVGASFLNLSNDKSKVVQEQRLGVAISPSVYLNVAADIFKDSDNTSRLALGAEFILPEELLQVGQLALRVGYVETDDQGENRNDSIVSSLSLQRTQGVTMGVGLYSTELTGYGIGFDYAIIPAGALGVGHQMQLVVKF